MSYFDEILSQIQPVAKKIPTVGPSWFSKALVGEFQCLLYCYLEMRYKLPQNKDFSSYNWQHASFVRERKQFWQNQGYHPFVEDQNNISFFTKVSYLTDNDIKFFGKPDLYISEINHFEELKTGKPKYSDVIQVMLYMAAAPYVYGLEQIPSGEVLYRNGSCKTVLPQEISQDFRNEATKLIELLASNQVPEPEPSQRNCRFCKLNQHCPVSAAGDVA